MWSLQSYTHMCLTMHGYPSPISLDKLYDSLYQPRPMAPPSVDNSHKERLPHNNNDDDDEMMPACAPGCSAATLHMRNFAATSMEQENETNWDSESDQLMSGFQPAGLSDQEECGGDNYVDMGDHPAVADEPPIVKHSRIEGADGRAEVPTSQYPPT